MWEGRGILQWLWPSTCEEGGMMHKIKLLVAVVALMVTMSTAALAQTESGWYNYPDEGGWWYYWAETGEWAQDPGTQPATTAGSVCDTVKDGTIVVNGHQIC
jgi:opacity protein-like surface antigen